MAASLPRMLAAVPKVAHGFYGDPDTISLLARGAILPGHLTMLHRADRAFQRCAGPTLCERRSAIGEDPRAFVSKYFWQEILR